MAPVEATGPLTFPMEVAGDVATERRASRRLRLDDCGETLTLEELAAVRGISVRTIQRELHDGKCPIPALRHGRRGRGCKWSFSRRAVERYFETGETWPATARGFRRSA